MHGVLGVVPLLPSAHAAARARAPFPRAVRRLARAVRAATGQACNHAVVNRHVGGADAIGARADKALDLADDSLVASVSWAPRAS